MTPTTALSAERLRLWRSQIAALIGLELRRILQPMALALLAIAAFPSFIILMHVLFDRGCNVERETSILAGLFQFYYLRVGIFLGCLTYFGSLFRREAMQRTLHYVFLAPVRREVLLVGRFIGSLASCLVIFELAWLLAFFALYLHSGPQGWEFVLHGAGLSHLMHYLGIIALACLGFGSIFLALGLLFRNPVLPAVILLAAESFSALLPGWLQRLTVTFYLKPLLPFPLADEGPAALFSFVVEPVAPVVAVAGLVVFAAVVLGIAAWGVRRYQINYSVD